MKLLFVILIVLYALSIIGCIEPLGNREVELNLPVLLLVLCPIVNTIIAIKNANWSDAKTVFTKKRS